MVDTNHERRESLAKVVRLFKMLTDNIDTLKTDPDPTYIIADRKMHRLDSVVETFFVESYSYIIGITSSKLPPPKYAHMMSTLLKEVNRKRKPTKFGGWLSKNLPYLRFMAEGHMEDWPDINDAPVSEALIRVDKFNLINQDQIKGKDVDLAVEAIKVADELIRRQRIPRADEILRGEVLLVKKGSSAKAVAFYSITNDSLYVVVKKSVANLNTFANNILHELGHRYWYKVMSEDQKKRWKELYYDIKRASGGDYSAFLKSLKVGRSFEFFGENHTIQKVDFSKERVYVTQDTFIPLDSIVDVMYRGFPSAYAATSEKEFWAESFQFLCRSKLPPSIETVMIEILENKNPPTL